MKSASPLCARKPRIVKATLDSGPCRATISLKLSASQLANMLCSSSTPNQSGTRSSSSPNQPAITVCQNDERGFSEFHGIVILTYDAKYDSSADRQAGPCWP